MCQYVTLPHIDILERLLTTHEFLMTSKVIPSQSLGECVSYLIFGINRKDLDKALSNMLSRMVITNINVLCPGS
jgi:hypothetical protein